MSQFDDVDTTKQFEAAVIAGLIDAYIARYGCGETAGCETCGIGVAIDLEHLDAAYNAGHAVGKLSK